MDLLVTEDAVSGHENNPYIGPFENEYRPTIPDNVKNHQNHRADLEVEDTFTTQAEYKYANDSATKHTDETVRGKGHTEIDNALSDKINESAGRVLNGGWGGGGGKW